MLVKVPIGTDNSERNGVDENEEYDKHGDGLHGVHHDSLHGKAGAASSTASSMSMEIVQPTNDAPSFFQVCAQT